MHHTLRPFRIGSSSDALRHVCSSTPDTERMRGLQAAMRELPSKRPADVSSKAIPPGAWRSFPGTASMPIVSAVTVSMLPRLRGRASGSRVANDISRVLGHRHPAPGAWCGNRCELRYSGALDECVVDCISFEDHNIRSAPAAAAQSRAKSRRNAAALTPPPPSRQNSRIHSRWLKTRVVRNPCTARQRHALVVQGVL